MYKYYQEFLMYLGEKLIFLYLDVICHSLSIFQNGPSLFKRSTENFILQNTSYNVLFKDYYVLSKSMSYG